MKKLKSLKEFTPISNEGLNSVRGGATMHTITVIAKRICAKTLNDRLEPANSDDGDDGISND